MSTKAKDHCAHRAQRCANPERAIDGQVDLTPLACWGELLSGGVMPVYSPAMPALVGRRNRKQLHRRHDNAVGAVAPMYGHKMMENSTVEALLARITAWPLQCLGRHGDSLATVTTRTAAAGTCAVIFVSPCVIASRTIGARPLA